MAYQFHKHYDRGEARALLPKIRDWLKRLVESRRKLQEDDKKLSELMEGGRDVGGELVNAWIGNIAELKAVLMEFHQREIQIKDLDRGLIDFPTIIAGQEAFLCWEKREKDIQFWHALDAGYAGRERLEEAE